MAKSYRTLEFTNKTGQAADDLHITWNSQGVEVIGVDGKSPEAPDSETTVEESGGESDLSNINVGNNGTIKIRIRTNTRNAPPTKGKPVQFQWTQKGRRIGAPDQLAAVDEPGGGGAESENAALRLLDAKVELISAKLNQFLATHGAC